MSACRGGYEWGQRFGGTDSDYGYSVAVDAIGNVLLTGGFTGGVDFGGGVLNSAGYYDIFVAKYDADGSHLWSKRFGGPSLDDGYALAVDATGNVLLTGYFTTTPTDHKSSRRSTSRADSIWFGDM